VLNGRKSLITVLASAALAVSVGMIPTDNAQADPSITDVQHRVDRLYHAAEQASERYNQIHVQLKQMRGDVQALKADEALQKKQTEQARRVVADAIVNEYEGASLSAVGQAVVSNDPSQFVSQLSTMSAFNTLQTSRYASYLTQAKALNIRHDATKAQLDKVASLEKQAAADKAEIDKNLAAAKDLLGNLKEKEQERLAEASRSASPVSTTVPTDVPASGRAGAAVAYAMAQIGKPYVYGAAGPRAFDCSGYTHWVFSKVGRHLPRTAAAQARYAHRIRRAARRTGDLVFFSSHRHVYHVGIYAGHNRIWHAPRPGQRVGLVRLWTSHVFYGRVR
jgi:peptidoglycan DL-endopeptidase CwlO